MTENEISKKVIGIAIDIHKALGPGLLESTYQECLFYKLQKSAFHVEKEKKMPLFFEGVELEYGYRFGIIDPHKHDFCEDCNRIRLTAEGMLIPCLYFDEAMSIKDAVQKGDVQGAANVLKEVLANKPEKNKWSSDATNETSDRAFYETGG